MALKKEVQPVFECAQHPKSGRNLQHLHDWANFVNDNKQWKAQLVHNYHCRTHSVDEVLPEIEDVHGE